MQYYWLHDQNRLKFFDYYWRKGKLNIADYFSKYFPAQYHLQQRPLFLQNIIEKLCKLEQYTSIYTTKIKESFATENKNILSMPGEGLLITS